MDRVMNSVGTNVAPGRRPAFEQLVFEATSRALGVPPISLGLAGSGLRPDAVEDIQLLAVAKGPPPSHLRVAAFGRTLNIVLESSESLSAELNEPRRPSLIRTLAGVLVVRDSADLLLLAAKRAGRLLEGPPPSSVHRNELTLSYEIRDAATRLSSESAPMRAMLRGALLEKIINLAFIRVRSWPAPLSESIDVLTSHDVELGSRLRRALEDDVELQALADWMVNVAPARRPIPGPKVSGKISEPAVAGISKDQNLWQLPPPALARLSPESASAIGVDDLRRMSKLQVLTVQRVHGPTMAAPARGFISGLLSA